MTEELFSAELEIGYRQLEPLERDILKLDDATSFSTVCERTLAFQRIAYYAGRYFMYSTYQIRKQRLLRLSV